MGVGITIDGLVLRRLRNDRLWSQAELAARGCAFALAEGDRQCGITRETVSKLERGRRTPSPRTLRYLVGALRPAAADLRRLLGRTPPPALVDLTVDGAGNPRAGDATSRRELLCSGLAAAAGVSLDAVQRMAQALDGPATVDDHLLAALLAQPSSYGACVAGLAPAVLAGAAARHLRTIAQLDGAVTTYRRRQLLQADGAGAAALVGWLSWALDRPVDARDATLLAWRLAHDAGDHALQRRVLDFLSWLASTSAGGEAKAECGGVACWRTAVTARHRAGRDQRGRA